MTEIICPGLDGTNPLHFLAALGVLRLISQHDSYATLVWRWNGHWVPVIEHAVTEWPDDEHAAVAIATDLNILAMTGAVDPTLNQRLAKLKSDKKKAEENRKKSLQNGKVEAKDLPAVDRRHYLDKIAQGQDRIIVCIQRDLDAVQDGLNDALGAGIAHLGPIIGVPPALFRRKASQACASWLTDFHGTTGSTTNELLAWALAAQASDGICDRSMVVPTPLSFGNGAGGQCLLKDFRSCAVTCTGDAVLGTWQGSPLWNGDITGLNWDPADQRNYALQWGSPASGRLHDPAINSLAFVGLADVTTMPGSSGLRAVGWQRRRPEGFRWPIWDVPLKSVLIRSLMARSLGDDRRLDPPGVAAVFQAERINPTGKRNFFAPACPV